MNVLSLFTGIGGLDLGLERAGMRLVGQVERDEWCRRVLGRAWPGVPRHDEVGTAVGWWRSRPRPVVDLVAGGFPCQPFSAAGRRRGVADERWGWPWMCDVVDALRPRFVLVENSPRLLGDTRAFSVLLRDLSELGFDAEWSVVPACAVGAPHTRERLFVVAYPEGGGVEQRGWFELAAVGDRAGDVRAWSAESEPCRVADGVPGRMDRLRALGNAVVPAAAELVGRMLVDGFGG